MNFKTITAVLLVAFWVRPFVLGAEQHDDAPANGAIFPDAVDRGMLLDAWQMQERLGPTYGSTTITGSVTLQDPKGSLNPTRQQHAISRPGWPFQTNGEIFSNPCFDDKYMYFGACDGIFYCLDKKTAVIRWRKEGFERVDSAPALHEGTVFFTGCDGTLYAMKSDSGEARWNAKAPGIGGQNPKLLNKTIYVAGEGQLLGFDPRNGKALRRHAFLGSGGDFAWNSKAIVVAVYRDLESKNFTGKGSVVCFAHDSAEPRWTTVLGGACLGTLVCDENNCYLGAHDGFFYAIRMTDGKIVWRIDCRRLFSSSGSENQLPQPASGHEKGPVWADEHVIDEGTHVAFSMVINSLTLRPYLHWRKRRQGSSSGPCGIPHESVAVSSLRTAFSRQWPMTGRCSSFALLMGSLCLLLPFPGFSERASMLANRRASLPVFPSTRESCSLWGQTSMCGVCRCAA